MTPGTELQDRRVLIFVHDHYEDLELWYPRLRLIEAGVRVTVAGPELDKKYIGKNGYPCVSDGDIPEMEAADFQGVVCPGGWMPDKLRRDPKGLQLMQEGGKWKFFIPSDLAYGPQGSPPRIPPHSTLVFEVELLDVVEESGEH